MHFVDTSFLAITFLAVLAPLLARGLGRWVRVPLVVFELLLGILMGPSLLGWVGESEIIDLLSEFGLAMLFFVAGTEIQASTMRGRLGRNAWVGWFMSVAAGFGLGWVLVPGEGAIIVAVAFASTALGTLLPILRDAGELRTPYGQAVSALGTVGEFGPLIAISIFLGGREPGPATVVLAIFAVIAGFAVWWAMRVPQGSLHEFVSSSLHTSGQFAVRTVLLIVAAMVTLSLALDIDMLLGAFTAGVLWRLIMREASEHDRHAVESKIEGLAFGFLVPIFFIYTGVTFDLRALIEDPLLAALVPVTLVLLFAIRGLPSMLVAPPGSLFGERLAIGLMGATGLPIIVAVTAIGVNAEIISSGIASVLVGAGMLSVLLFPLIASALHGEKISRSKDALIENEA
ncbi:cation:proton antiporter [Microbacterium sp. C7(2022)]|uniref:cation:proton antiporter n=1 Tax=Microbacterium sp. C7(2022) TaxID=2992759 RepID=UPI00237BD721|nr:cation:proton antiporter [Microbacterium sp. C7(2022)]MDE0545242.1 cation:proton antiporter [Microbacterium sp. C7(2022)]